MGLPRDFREKTKVIDLLIFSFLRFGSIFFFLLYVITEIVILFAQV